MAMKHGKTGGGGGGGEARKREKALTHWETLFEEALTLVEDGAPDEAVDLLREAETVIAPLGPQDEGRLGATRVELAEALIQLDRDEEAADAATAALPALAGALDDADDELAELLSRAAHVQSLAGRDAAAIDTFERALGVRARALGADHSTSAPILAGIACSHLGLGNVDRAETFADQAVERAEGLHDERQAVMLEALLEIARSGGDAARALRRIETVRDRVRAECSRPVEPEELDPARFADELDFDAAQDLIRRRAFLEAGVEPPSLLLLGKLRAEALALLDRRDEAIVELEALEANIAARERWAADLVADLEDELGDEDLEDDEEGDDEDDDDIEDDGDDEDNDDDDEDDRDADDEDEEDDEDDDEEEDEDEDDDDLEDDEEGLDDDDEEAEGHVHGEDCGCGAEDPFHAAVLLLHARLLRETAESRGEKAPLERALELLDRAQTLLDSEDPEVDDIVEERAHVRRVQG